MKYLLDTSALLAAVWESHEAFDVLDRWMPGKELAVCPLAELGLLRISTQLTAPFRATMAEA